MKSAKTRIGATRLWMVFLVLLVSSAARSIVAAQTPGSADDLVHTAVKTAKAQNKVVLVHFGASWCEWCRHLDEMLQGKELGKLIADHFVVVHLTVQESDDKKKLETPGGEAMLAAQGAAKAGVPVFMFFDQDGNKIADSLALPNHDNIGYPATPGEIQAFAGILEKTAPRMTIAQRASIVDYLKKHAPSAESSAAGH